MDKGTLWLKPIGSNQTEARLKNGLMILFSYSTPVAIRNSAGREFFTTTKFSNTTSRHINKWLYDKKHATPISQQEIVAEIGEAV